MNPLLAELTDDQVALLKVLHGEFEGHARWPIWQYVDLLLKPLGTAEAALRALPKVGDTRLPLGARYGLVWWQNSGISVPSPETPIGLTIAGLHRLGFGESVAELWIKLLRYLITQQSQLLPSPTTVVQCVLDVDDLREHLFAGTPQANDPAGLVATRLAQLRLLIEHEPPFWGRIQQPFVDGAWSIEVPVTIVRYEGVETVDEYIERITADLTPEPMPLVSGAPSRFTLPEATSFLDAVWQARLGARLFANLDADSVAKLVSPVSGPSEFDSCTSALADVLAHITVPHDDSLQRKNRRPITVLGDWLRPRLAEPGATRVDDAIAVLEQIVDVRVGTQHSESRHKAVKAFESLGLTFPPMDWQQAWVALQARAVGALEAIREELQASAI